MTSSPALDRGTRVQSVDRAVSLLRAVSRASGRDSTAAALADSCGLNRATAWRLLTTLEANGLVVCNRVTHEWSIGAGIALLADHTGLDSLRERSRAVLARLSEETGETAAFAVVGESGLTYVEEVAPSRVVAATWLGRTVPWHATSTGKAVLAGATAARVRALVGADPKRYTATTIVSGAQFADELRRTRELGYAVCRGEFELSAWGVSSSVVNSAGATVGALSVWGPASRVDEAHFAVLGPLVRARAVALGAGIT